MKNIFRFSFLLLVSLWGCQNTNPVHSQKSANQLINESSPYLLQHAYNPVDWHPWGEETLQKAKDENKLLIISIGYAACHWCHVMEHESFEDDSVAAMMNKYFLPIKVDREERPDVDRIYMSAANLITGRGGWPLNAFALPDGRPVWAGTYFAKDQWMKILEQFASLQENDYQRLEKSAEQIVSGIQSMDQIVEAEVSEFTEEQITIVAQNFIKQIDQIEGGRRGVPKFPMPNNYDYLLKYGSLYKDHAALEAVEITLDKMAMGGIYDHAGGGFARYSVDDIWLVPHFEKMLYDNGQLISLYSDAYRATGKARYKEVVAQTIEFIERELMNDEGRFYSSLDADSEGEEGKFYVWTASEIDALFPNEKESAIIKAYYNITEEGNWEHGKNILHMSPNAMDVATQYAMSKEELQNFINGATDRLLNERSKRVRPGLDDKILTSWNALVIKGYVDAYKAFGTQSYLDRAIQSANNLMDQQMQSDFRLLRNHKDGKSSINAFLDDYALTIQAFIALYELTFDESWLINSRRLADYAIEHFLNDENRMFFYTSDIDPPLVARKMELSDEVIPSSNSIMARNLFRLGELYYNEEYLDLSKQMLANILPSVERSQQPSFYSNWLQLHVDQVNPPYEVAITGNDALAKSHEMMKTYRPNAIFLGSMQDSDMPLLKYKYVDGQTMIYVCQNKTCKLPVQDVASANKLMSD